MSPIHQQRQGGCRAELACGGAMRPCRPLLSHCVTASQLHHCKNGQQDRRTGTLDDTTVVCGFLASPCCCCCYCAALCTCCCAHCNQSLYQCGTSMLCCIRKHQPAAAHGLCLHLLLGCNTKSRTKPCMSHASPPLQTRAHARTHTHILYLSHARAPPTLPVVQPELTNQLHHHVHVTACQWPLPLHVNE